MRTPGGGSVLSGWPYKSVSPSWSLNSEPSGRPLGSESPPFSLTPQHKTASAAHSLLHLGTRITNRYIDYRWEPGLLSPICMTPLPTPRSTPCGRPYSIDPPRNSACRYDPFFLGDDAALGRYL